MISVFSTVLEDFLRKSVLYAWLELSQVESHNLAFCLESLLMSGAARGTSKESARNLQRQQILSY